mgnify:FL=1|jgi:hypothetical protein
MEFLEIIFFSIFTVFAVKALWLSTQMLDERKQRYRDGTHDYYGNKIEKDEENG